jgi:hypothetical protein
MPECFIQQSPGVIVQDSIMLSLLLQGLAIGCVNKIYLKFPYRWWPQPYSGFSFLWTDEDKQTFKPSGNTGGVRIVFSYVLMLETETLNVSKVDQKYFLFIMNKLYHMAAVLLLFSLPNTL